jgi:hypothetical protein
MHLIFFFSPRPGLLTSLVFACMQLQLAFKFSRPAPSVSY